MTDSRLLYLPASTLILVVLLFALQAISSPSMQPQQLHHLKTGTDHTANRSGNLPVLGQVADFKFTERSQNTLAAADLRGKVWVADFIFTSCQKECPLMSAEMQKIQAAFEQQKQLKLVSFSVDPAVDTPARLQEYAQHFKANENWLFLTGKREALHQLAKDSFKLPVVDLNATIEHDHGQNDPAHASEHNAHGEHKAHNDTARSTPEASASSPFLHSQKFVLVDSQLQIRGYYDSTSPEELAQLIQTDIPALLKG